MSVHIDTAPEGGSRSGSERVYYSICVPMLSTNGQGHDHDSSSGRRAVQRTYTDFAWLRARLAALFGGAIVPLLPEGGIKGALRSSGLKDADRFRAKRHRLLSMWLQYVAWHPVLRHTPEVHAFVYAGCGTSGTRGRLRADLSNDFAANTQAFTEAARTSDAMSAAAVD